MRRFLSLQEELMYEVKQFLEEKENERIIFSITKMISQSLLLTKDANHSVGDGMQQALNYAEVLDIPFVYSSNGSGFLEHDRLKKEGDIEREISLDSFPSPDEMYHRYKEQKQLTKEVEEAVLQDYYRGLTSHSPRYYQRVAINRAVEAVARGQNRILLVMATGTGKTYTAFQIIWRL